MRALVEFVQSPDTDGWERRHALGEVPDASPYGLHRLAEHGVTPVWPPRRGGLAHRVVAKASGVRLLEGWSAPPGADLRLCWDERAGIPAVLDARTLRRPVVSGVIWATEAGASRRARVAVRALRRADRVWCLSTGQLAALRALRCRAEYVPFGIDADFWTAPPEVAPEPGLVASAGNDRNRDHATLTAAVRSTHSARLEIATAAPLPAGDPRLVRHASLTHGRLRSLYARASVVAVATRPNAHCSGITCVLEAMACARPVVVTRTAGMSDYIEHGVSGLLVPPGDPTAMAAALAELVGEPDRARAMGLAARRRVMDEGYTTAAMAERLAHLARSAAAAS